MSSRSLAWFNLVVILSLLVNLAPPSRPSIAAGDLPDETAAPTAACLPERDHEHRVAGRGGHEPAHRV